MNGNMLICAPVCLLLCLMLPAGSKKIRFIVNLPEKNPGINQMSMVENAVDDMYFGCSETSIKMMDKYFKKEYHGIFKDVWKKAGNCAKKKLRTRDKGDEALTKDHLQAICVYTADYKRFYETFNYAVRTNRSVYRTTFPFHYLHFWLTSAVQILNDNKKCHHTYRRTNAKFSGNVTEIIRFGSFSSSSYNKALTRFGKETCFKIKTCEGASLKNYSALGNKEEEVLIPPYEKFKITKETKGQSVDGLFDCKTVYFLESAGVHSNLNCHAGHITKDQRLFFN